MKVSVVVSVLNGARYIRDIIDYLRSQTHPDIEPIFIVSSRSTDGTYGIIKECSKELPSLILVDYEDTGKLGGSKNCGLDRATGDCIWFLDVDDRPSNHCLEYLTRIMEDHDADVVACNYVYTCNGELPSERAFDKDYVDIMTSKTALKRRLTERFPVASWSMIYRTETIRSNGLRFKEGMCEDIAFTVSMLGHSTTVCYYRDVLYSYNIHDSSYTSSHSDERGGREVDIYTYLSSSCDNRFMRQRMLLTMLRSMGHMSLRGFITTLYSDGVRDSILRYGDLHAKFEYSFMRALPLCYYGMIRLFFKGYFYKSGRTFTRRPQ